MIDATTRDLIFIAAFLLCTRACQIGSHRVNPKSAASQRSSESWKPTLDVAIYTFVGGHPLKAVEQIARGTIWPRQAVHHLPATPDVFHGLSRLAAHHAVPEICCHLVIYRPSRVLVDWYDAFDREVYVSSMVPEKLVREFAEIVSGSYRIETT